MVSPKTKQTLKITAIVAAVAAAGYFVAKRRGGRESIQRLLNALSEHDSLEPSDLQQAARDIAAQFDHDLSRDELAQVIELLSEQKILREFVGQQSDSGLWAEDNDLAARANERLAELGPEASQELPLFLRTPKMIFHETRRINSVYQYLVDHTASEVLATARKLNASHPLSGADANLTEQYRVYGIDATREERSAYDAWKLLNRKQVSGGRK